MATAYFVGLKKKNILKIVRKCNTHNNKIATKKARATAQNVGLQHQSQFKWKL